MGNTIKNTREVIKIIEAGVYTDILFDCDETIIHFLIDWSKIFSEFHKLAKKYELEEEFETMDINGFLEYMVSEKGEEAKSQIEEILLHGEQDHCSDIIPNKELIAWIENNYTSYNFYCISNNMTPTIYTGLEKFNIKKYFKDIIGRDSVFLAKPNPEGILKIQEKYNLKKETMLMIGDNPDSDGIAANKAEIDYICITMNN